MAKLVAIGDSLTQGFLSGAAFETDWSYPAMIARAMGLEIGVRFQGPSFPANGLPLNFEAMLRRMEQQDQLGPDIDGFFEWWLEFPLRLREFANGVKQEYENGAGIQPVAFDGIYHNLAIWGFRVLDSFTVSSEYCQKVINAPGSVLDDIVGLPSAPMYRAAQRVLNPRQIPERKTWTQLHNLQHIVEQDGDQLENLIIWLGSNDCLATVTTLSIQDMDRTNVSADPQKRRAWNLTHPQVFRADFEQLVNQVAAIIPSHTQVFVGTIAKVTIPPVTQGVGEFDGKYFERYGSFFATQENSGWPQRWLLKDQAQYIDQRIDSFNATIRELVQQREPKWHIVETGEMLNKLAVKRNNMQDTPDRPLHDFFTERGRPDHPLLQLDPVPNVLRLTTENGGHRVKGGLFSLDCFHPSTIGYGLIAEEFLRVMQASGVADADPNRLNWAEIIAHDTLLQPPQLWDDITTAAERNPIVWDILLRVVSTGTGVN